MPHNNIEETTDNDEVENKQLSVENLEKNEEEKPLKIKLLVDVDNTLLSSEKIVDNTLLSPEKINENLLVIFELFGLKELSFLTNMPFSTEPSVQMASRSRLITTLQERGFNIEFVHTPLDLQLKNASQNSHNINNINILDENFYQPGVFYNHYYKEIEERRDELITHHALKQPEKRREFFKKVKDDIKNNTIRNDDGFHQSKSFIEFYTEKYQSFANNYQEPQEKIEKKHIRQQLASRELISELDTVIFIDDSPIERKSYKESHELDFVVPPPRYSGFPDHEDTCVSCADFIKFLCDKVQLELKIDEHTVSRFLYLAEQEKNRDTESAKFLYKKAKEFAEYSGQTMDFSESAELEFFNSENPNKITDKSHSFFAHNNNWDYEENKSENPNITYRKQKLFNLIHLISKDTSFWQNKVRCGKVPDGVETFAKLDNLEDIITHANKKHSSHFFTLHRIFRGRNKITNEFYRIIKQVNVDDESSLQETIDRLTELKANNLAPILNFK